MTTTTVPFRSILFDRPPATAERTDPSVFTDLNLDQVFAAVTVGRDEYDLMPFFSTPLHDLQTVEYRHQILRDMEDGALWRMLAEFADRMADMRKHLEQSAKLRYRYQKESWFLDAARIYRQAVSALADALTAINPSSHGFITFREYLEAYTRSQAFGSLAADIDKVTDALASVRYCVNIRGTRVKVTRYEKGKLD